MLIARASDWQAVLDASFATFQYDRLAELCLRTKPEKSIRDALAFGLESYLGKPSRREFKIDGARVDIVSLSSSGSPNAWIELRQGTRSTPPAAAAPAY